MQLERKVAAMTAPTAVPLVDTTIVPDRNAGMGSLLRDLLHPQDPDRDEPPLLDRKFAFIDVGVSRARVATALHTLLAGDLGMNVDYVATERPEAVPLAHITLLGDRGEKVRGSLSGMISSRAGRREVGNWHFVVDREGRVSAIAYSYDLLGNEVWESYFMGRTFIHAGEHVEFKDPELDEALAPDVAEIEAKIAMESKSGSGASRAGISWDGYRIERNPLEVGLAKSGIALQKTHVPQRIDHRQNVLFLGNVLNHYPHGEQTHELDRIAASLADGDLVIVQVDEGEKAFVEVLRVRRQGDRHIHQRVRWIDTRKLEVRKAGSCRGAGRLICMSPDLERVAGLLVDCVGMKVNSPAWRRADHKDLARQFVMHVFRTFFRALPVDETLRIATREALRRLPTGQGLKGIPVFTDDANDVYGGALGLDRNPIVSDAVFVSMRMASPKLQGTPIGSVQCVEREA